jgi:hypothetical protein
MEVTRNELLENLPAYSNNKILVVKNQDTRDIIKDIIAAHKDYGIDYDKISEKFWKGNTINTAEYIFEFAKDNIKYCVEPEKRQSIKSPSAILATGIYNDGYNDCKHYACFIGGILDSLRRSGKPIDWFYRFANYIPFENDPQHVFVVVKKDGWEYYVDPVLDYFNEDKEFINCVDKKIPINKVGELYRISGISTSQALDLEENQAAAAAAFASGNYSTAVSDEINDIESVIADTTSKVYTPGGRVNMTQTNLAATLKNYGLYGPNGIYSKFAETNNAGGLNLRLDTSDWNTIECWSGNGPGDYESIGLTISQFGGDALDLVEYVLSSGYTPQSVDLNPTFGSYYQTLTDFYNSETAAGATPTPSAQASVNPNSSLPVPVTTPIPGNPVVSSTNIPVTTPLSSTNAITNIFGSFTTIDWVIIAAAAVGIILITD